MKILSIEFSHGPVSVYAHSFESERVTMHVKGFLNTFKQFSDLTHELSPGIGRVTICSTNPSAFLFTLPNTIGTLHLHFSNGRDTIDQDVIISTLQSSERTAEMEKLLTVVRLLIQTTESERISA